MADTPLSLILFSGTDDRLSSAAILAAGAAAMGRPVNVFLQYWALAAFRASTITEPLGATAGTTDAEQALVRRSMERQHWSEVLRQAKDIGEVRIHACAMSMEMLGLSQADLDPLVDDIYGVAAFIGDAADGAITMI